MRGPTSKGREGRKDGRKSKEGPTSKARGRPKPKNQSSPMPGRTSVKRGREGTGG